MALPMNQALKTVLPVKKRVKARNKKIVETVAEQEIDPSQCSQEILLNPEQQSIVDDFITAYDSGDHRPCLIHGVTGSGKTEVYMALIDHVLLQGKQAIVLIPRDCPDLSDREPLLQPLWKPHLCHAF